jgi:glutaredoxin 3
MNNVLVPNLVVPHNLHSKESRERKTMADVNAIVDKAPVVIFSKTTDPYSCKSKKLITQLGFKFKPVELDEILEQKEREGLESSLRASTGSAATPYIFIGKKYIGNNKDLQLLHKHNKLQSLLQSAGGLEYGKI